jgi:hypothetical protein
MTDPYGTVRAQIIDLQGNAVGGQPSNNDWRLVVDNEQLKFQHYDATANSGNGAFLTRQSFGTGLTGINVVPQGTYSINGNLQVTDDLTVDGGSLFVDASTNRVGFGTLTPSQSVHIVGNAYVDGDLTVTGSASISSSSVWTKTGGTNEVYYTGANVGVGTNNPEAQLDVNGTSKFTGNMTMKGHIIPDATNTYDLGSATKTFRHVYVGPGSLYVNGKQVVTDDSGTITISTDADQNLSLKTSGSGNVQINATGTGDLEFGAGGIIQMKKTLQMLDGQKITSSGSTTVVCGNNFQAEGSLRGTTLTLDGTNTVSAAELNVLDGATAGAVVASKAVVVDANRDISNLRNLTITGDLTVSGTTTTVNSTTVSVADSLFKYASANTADAVDMGWYGKYVDSGVTKYSGMFRDATNGSFNLFTANQVEPATTVDTTGTGYAKANMVVGDIDFTSGTMRGHILPSVNDSFDIGSAEYKIRDMYVSDSSLWIGDQHKVTISGGKMKFRKRKITSVPAAILTETAKAENGSLNATQTLTAALNNSSGVSEIANMKLKHWKAYMRTLSGKGSAKIRDIFRDTSDDYDEDTGADAWLESGSNAYRASGNVGIGTNNPGKKFCVEGDIVSQNGTKALTLTAGINDTGSIWSNTSWDPANPTSNWGEAIRFNGTNVAIGNITATEKLEVGGAIKLGNADNSVAGTIKFQGGDFYGAKTNGTWTSLTSAGGSSAWSEAGSIVSYGGGATITGTLKLNSGDGTEKIYLTTGGTAGSKIRTSTGEYVDFYAGDGGVTTEGGFKWLTTQSSAYVERMRITKDGWVGIGTDNPSRLLHLKDGNGSTYIDGKNILINRSAYYFAPTSESTTHDLYIGDVNQNSASNYTRFDNVTVGYKGEFRVRKGKDEAQFVIDTNGSVGIGTNSPLTRLHSYKAVTGDFEALKIQNSLGGSNGNSVSIGFNNYGSELNTGFIQNYRDASADYSLRFSTYTSAGLTEHLVLRGGNVGIGDSSPSYKLDVTGDINFTGTLRKNGSEYGNGSSVWSTSGSTAIYTNNVEIGPSNQEMKIGAIHGGWMGFSHKDMFTETNYAMIQSNTGDTRINIKSGGTMGFMENNQWKMTLKGGKLGIGVNDPKWDLSVNQTITVGAFHNTGGGGNAMSTGNLATDYGLRVAGYAINQPGRIQIAYLDDNNYFGMGMPIEVGKIGFAINESSANTSHTTGKAVNIAEITSYTHVSNQFDGSLIFRTSDGDTNAPSLGDRMIIDKSGNVGIGTSSPSKRLHVIETATGSYSSIHNAMRVGVDASDRGSIANGFGVGLELWAQRGSSGNDTATGRITSYLLGQANTPHDIWGMGFQVRDNDTWRTPLTIYNNGNVDIGGIPSRSDGGTNSLGTTVIAGPISVPSNDFTNSTAILRVVGTNATNNIQMGVGNSSYGYNGWIQASYDNSTGSSDFGTKSLLINPLGGYVGIGNTTPNYPLHVNGSGGSTTGPLYAFHRSQQGNEWRNDSGASWTQGSSDPVSLKVEHGIIASRMYFFSDSRIKKDIVDVSDDQSLIKLRQLQPKKYKYKEPRINGDQEVYGFIAQEVKTVIPSSVTIKEDYLPDMMVSAKISSIEINGNAFIGDNGLQMFTDCCILTTEADHQLQVNDVISCRDIKYDTIDNIKVLEVISSKAFKINKIFTAEQSTFEDENGFQEQNVIFIFGKKVNDFHNLNKNAIWTIATAALQEVDRQLQAEKAKVATLETELAAIKTHLGL